MTETHTLTNQSSPLIDYNMYSSDNVLTDLMTRYGASWATERLSAFGQFAGSARAIELAIQANNNEPVLHTHSRFGERIDAGFRVGPVVVDLLPVGGVELVADGAYAIADVGMQGVQGGHRVCML